VGFMDITDTQRHTLQAPLPKVFSYPDRPQRQEIVRPLIHDILEYEGVEKLESFLRPLTEFHNRYYTGAWGEASSIWIARYAQQLINTYNRTQDAFVELKVCANFPQMNIVARIVGTNPNAEGILIIGAHMDSINSVGPRDDWPTNRAPGADDDGSGSTAVMGALQALLQSHFRPERTVEFHWYAAEELGLLGSRELARQYRVSGVDVYAMLQIDMAASSGPMKFIMDYVNVDLSKFEMELVDEYCVSGWEEGACGYACSDHASWNDEGYPSSFPIESGPYWPPDGPADGLPCGGHTINDRFECVDLRYTLDYARLAVSFVVELGLL